MAFSFFGKNKHEEEPHKGDEVVQVPLTAIISNRFQPRQIFTKESIGELADTIREHGLLQPIILREYEPHKYEIIAGERRFKAIETLNWEKIPAIVRKMSDNEAASMAMIENLQRESLTAIEEAQAYQQLMKLNGLTQGQLGQAIGKSQSFVANKLRLLKLSSQVQEAILQRKLTERHGRALVSLDQHQQNQLLEQIENKELSVKETEQLVQKNSKSKPQAKKKPKVRTKGTSRSTKVAVNTIKKSVKMVQDAGIKLKTSEEDVAGFHRMIIDIPLDDTKQKDKNK
ncbi:chromosome partitioning protein, DNA-binding protein [Ligilactobacillus acidipiscis DSM 15836]|uniref:Chromosome partitioning protein, DNA-binding protein n=1 Tax=Ligilactobacillus acidipiscis DSM 15836 TaxID=1423716 RepID=A0ABR5PNU1_9LACO|nr:nucleoid occlusion protein [Ligilactobacillus acidipiscis]KRM31261.1 chromosome partitioning protein, DNA-binding protein [Ligilactobacillus acidipiscis DSM 15836]GAW63556.1 chromosome partitioning protein ParB [Ligilactobacillus acidipiscis]GEN20303.1 nucleoid occlusion protein [Ligilactobacillus acidipiscis]